MEVLALREALIRSLGDIYRLEAFSALGDLLQGESMVLHFLLAARGAPMFPSALSQELRLSRSRITAAVNSLRRKGLVATEPCREDRRMVLVSLTEKGRELIVEKEGRMASYFDRMIKGLGPADTQRLIELIHRCVDVMGGQEQ
ncbi:MarR family transcriptional regulator [Oscillibacter sp. MSJ-2]|uniref:MarR family transcriptional regulator n=1 Tax=Dysosmobacter acutus TaxID=2841504 RepID=A0ABS6F6X1_9FIRM|nr:MarR family transcriptional regulator [Dysosmobacter acutus]MBU5625902.1 MarR family transcriptional regulator [Dysosmobacter acutus]